MPPSVDDGSPGAPSRTTFEGRVTYTCNNGYEFSPGDVTTTVSCLATGTWDTPPPCTGCKINVCQHANVSAHLQHLSCMLVPMHGWGGAFCLLSKTCWAEPEVRKITCHNTITMDNNQNDLTIYILLVYYG